MDSKQNEMIVLTHPGYNTQETIASATPRMLIEFMRFMDFPCSMEIRDIGESNWKSEQMRRYGHKVSQIAVPDFNFYSFCVPDCQIITCFEVLEHVQNPLFFMQQIKSCMSRTEDRQTVLYLSTPGRLRPFWSRHHFHEMSEKHLTKWILEPLGLKVHRSKSVRISDGMPFWFYFTGIRPFLRLFSNNTRIYEIILK